MRVLEYGRKQRKTLLFLPCTAEPEWAFTASVTLLAQDHHVMQIVYDGHGGTDEDFLSVEHTVDEVTDWLCGHGITALDAAYGCSLGGACLTRLLALGEIRVERAIIDGGITPYQLPLPVRGAICLADVLGFKLLAGSRKILEAAYPPEKFTLPGHDPVKEYDALAAYLKTYSGRTIRNIFWSANNFALPKAPAQTPCRLIYWYGDEEKKARRGNIRFIKRYFPYARTRGIPKVGHAELVMLHPQEFYRRVTEYLTHVPCFGRQESATPVTQGEKN